mmetsp:Transcript_24257/g.18450  ORF Transcript_24257/g.18450 Transcript_24257/m.18450 type:complete len:133 (-) Transcript_24257:184-582(-)
MNKQKKAKLVKKMAEKLKKEKVKKEAKTKERKEKKEKRVNVGVKRIKKPSGGQAEGEVNFNSREDLINEYIVRYWYSWPEWPPKSFSSEKALEERKYRKVDGLRWRVEPEEDNKGFRKVFELEFFPGVYKDS